MPAAEPYTVEIQLARGTNTTQGAFDLTLVDRDRSGISSSTVVGLDLGGERLALRDGSSIAPSDFCRRFLRGEACGAEEGLAFGRLLHERLFAGSAVVSLWREIRSLCKDRPLRVELILPDPSEPLLADLPFELLADEEGFIFRRLGHTLIRALRGSRGEHVQLGPGTRALCAWANPLTENRKGERVSLPAEVFAAHERALSEHGEKLEWTVGEPCREATREDLAARLTAEKPAVVSLIAHGPLQGGAVLLHNPDDPERPHDLGAPVDARDLAHDFKAGGVRVALLWSCHGGKQHPIGGAVAEALLRESHGGLAAVIASHAALRAGETATVTQALLRAWESAPNGDLERALTEARHALGEGDLQWAAPVYYARPLALRSVTLEERVRALVAAPGPAEAKGSVEGAPRRADYFRGRSEDRARIAALLREARLVNVVGMPGIGKTELILAVASDMAPGFERAIWLSLEGRGGIEAVRADLASRFGRKPDDCKEDRDIAAAIGGTRALLVLDNAEDLLRGTADKLKLQGLVSTILRECPEMSVLLSSRRTLGNPAGAREEVYRLDLLPAPHDKEAFLAAAGARLSPEERDSEELDALVKMLDGHPQSLVLVAGQVGQGTSLALLKERVEREGADAIVSAELLDADDLEEVPDAELRAKRLVSSLNLSFLPLVKANPGAAEMFAWLGHFPGGVPEVLLPEIFGDGAGEQVAALERQHLVEKRGEDRRVGLAAPIRWYATRQGKALAAEHQEHLLASSWQSLAIWLSAFTQTLNTHNAAAACAQALPEGDTLRTLLTAMPATASRPIHEHASLATIAFGRLMLYGGYPHEGLSVLEAANQTVRHVETNQPLASLNTALGECYLYLARTYEAEVAYNTALHLATSRNSPELVATILEPLGSIYVASERWTAGANAYQEALEHHRKTMNLSGQASLLWRIGEMHMKQVNTSEAKTAFEEGLALARSAPDPLTEANIMFSLGTLLWRNSETAEAKTTLESALQRYHEVGHQLGEANTLQRIQGMHLQAGDLDQAHRTQAHALDLFVKIGDIRGQTMILKAQGHLALARGNPSAAFARFSEVLAQHRRISPVEVAVDFIDLAEAARASGRPVKAIALAAESLREYRRSMIKGPEFIAYLTLGKALHAAADEPHAVASFLLSCTIADATRAFSTKHLVSDIRMVLPEFDFTYSLPPDVELAYTRQIDAVVALYEIQLKASGDDLISPLPEPIAEPL